MPTPHAPCDRQRFARLHREFASVVSQMAQMAEDEGAHGPDAVFIATSWARRILADIEGTGAPTTRPTTSSAPVTTLPTTLPTTKPKVKITAPPEILSKIRAMRDEGLSQRAMVRRMNAEKIRTHGGGDRWYLIQVQRILAAIDHAR